MQTYTNGLEDGLLLAALILEHNPEIRNPAGQWAVESLKLASQRLMEQRLRSASTAFTRLYQPVVWGA